MGSGVSELFIIPVLLISMAAAYGLSRWLTGLSREWALKKGIVAHVSHRSSHSVPTARLGGVGVALGFGVAAAGFLICLALLPHSYNNTLLAYRKEGGLMYLGLVAGWMLMLGVGLLDDVYDLPPLIKLGFSIVAALAPTLCGARFDVFFQLSYTSFFQQHPILLFILNVGVTLFWILFFVNAYNFMDGMDGFAGGFARLAAVFLFACLLERLIASVFHDLYPGTHGAELLLLPVLAAACQGFLYWNDPPAKVFMGDGGSFSVGYLLAITVILGALSRLYSGPLCSEFGPNDCGPLIPILSSLTILLPFIFDVVLTLIRRSLRGENILKAHREHLYQRLMKTGLSHAEVLRLTKKRFWACGVAALLGALPAHPAGRWAAFAFALFVMTDYWKLTLARERAMSVQIVENT